MPDAEHDSEIDKVSRPPPNREHPSHSPRMMMQEYVMSNKELPEEKQRVREFRSEDETPECYRTGHF